ncbi:imidazoleglycerol-phosphate dehydratase HisB [Candidatus Epulonipiscium viviparus]|uniref:imidazoleglycerol-phosphate dehydratase HisB n=1 Tax=Candidatus Epulonipiscium viviparus TaxID=420336 RepID=UPI00016BFDF4|nr:imidazoleglycerol-phosphate dehydratase HisB [Candidatus Epulopiscium viviparus]
MRKAVIERKTNETDIKLTLELDGTGTNAIDTDCGFLNHMLTLFAAHSRMNLAITCRGDSDVDFHHTVEDIAICLGAAIDEALGDKRGICRYGSCTLPMDEALVSVFLDFSGRGHLEENLNISQNKVGDFDTELCKEFLLAIARSAKMTLHVVQERGKNAHHIIEAVFKAMARAMREAVTIDQKFRNEIPSTKGVI